MTRCLLLSLLIYCVGWPKVHADPKPVDLADVELSVQQLSSPIGPAQAVRVRVLLRNVSKKSVGPLIPVDNVASIQLKGPNDADYQQLSGVVIATDRTKPSRQSAREHKNELVPLFLKPGEQTSVSFSLAARWRGGDGSRLPYERVKPVFTEPGKYLLKCRYLVDPKKEAYVEGTVEIVVHNLEGPDKLAFRIVEQNPALVAVLLNPVDAPPKEFVDQLKEIVDKYPESSYGLNARFALARWHIQEANTKPAGVRVARAFAGDQLERIMYEDPHGGTPAPAERPLVPRVGFPYQPFVLLAVKNVDFIQNQNADVLLKRDYSDALEWLEQVAGTLATNEWAALRIRGAAPK